MFYSGIDQHKRDCFITTYDSQGFLPPGPQRTFTS